MFGSFANELEKSTQGDSTGPVQEVPAPAQQATPEPAPAQEPSPAPSPAPQQTPTQSPPTSQSTQSSQLTAEVFGDGEAMVMVMDGGSSNQNTVQLPETYELEEGYVSVSVSRSPSIDSYMQGGTPDTGEVGCRIIRDGEVVDEQTANGEFANATCSKFM